MNGRNTMKFLCKVFRHHMKPVDCQRTAQKYTFFVSFQCRRCRTTVHLSRNASDKRSLIYYEMLETKFTEKKKARDLRTQLRAKTINAKKSVATVGSIREETRNVETPQR